MCVWKYRSEMNTIMTVGFACAAGSVFAAYVSMGVSERMLNLQNCYNKENIIKTWIIFDSHVRINI